MNQKIVEVRIPNMPTKTGDNTTWARTVRAVKGTAKTAYDWEGDLLRCGKLADLPRGEMFITVGSKGSRKHGEKLCKLYVVVDNDYIVMIAMACTNEWAVALRGTARSHLELSAKNRVLKALQDQIKFLRDESFEHSLTKEQREVEIKKHQDKTTQICLERKKSEDKSPIDRMFARFGKEFNDKEKADLLFGFIVANQYQDNFFHWVSHKKENSN